MVAIVQRALDRPVDLLRPLGTGADHDAYEIDGALERLYRDPKRFGVCERTGEPIPFARLDLIPWARTCDQERRSISADL